MTDTRAWALALLAVSMALGAAGEARAQDDQRNPAERYFARFQYRHFLADMTGDTHKGSDDIGFVDFNDDLGFADETTFDARGYFQFSRGKKVRFGYTR